MGAGKSTVLNGLKELGYKCIDEPARIVLAEQRASGGNGVPEKDPGLFIQLMLEKTIAEYENITETNKIVFFDRGFADLAAYANLFGFSDEKYLRTAEKFGFSKNVFMFNGWREIYRTDDERKMSFEAADEFGKNVKLIYEKLGYRIIDVPLADIEGRVDFIFKQNFTF
jgi:predicted ATPase